MLWRNLESISAGLVSLGTVKLGKHFMTYSIPEDMVKLTERVRGHFMTLTKCNIHQIDHFRILTAGLDLASNGG